MDIENLSASQRIRLYREKPCEMVEREFGVVPDKWQREALNAFASRDRNRISISLQACAGPGKSAVLAWCAWNFLACYGEIGDHPKGVAVSITFENLKMGLWTEMSVWQGKSEFLKHAFTWTQTKIFSNDHPETWFLMARSFPRGSDIETIGKTLSGIHGKYIAFFLDEVGDMPPAIIKTANQAIGESLARGGFVKLMVAGNPISTTGLLYEASKSEAFYTIRITGDPDDKNRSPRIDLEWAREQIKQYGRDNSWIQSYLLGRFPDAAINTLLTIDEVEDAMSRHYTVKDYGHAQKRLGVDVARFGADDTVIFPRQGLAAMQYVEMRGANGPQIASRILMAMQKWGAQGPPVEGIYLDGTGGHGASTYDSLEMSGQAAHEINFSSRAIESHRYFNKRAEIWFNMAQWIKRGGAIPRSDRLKKELLAVTYSFKDSRILLESKDQIKKRLGYSLDVSDALALTFSDPDQPAMDPFEYIRNESNGNCNFKTEYDPFKNI